MLLKNTFARILMTLMLLFAPLSAISQTSFDVSIFNELTSRAENAIYTGQTSSAALENLRSSLSLARSAALEAQSARSGRAKIISEQIDALGPVPSDATTEAQDVAALRLALNKQLAEARAPLIVAQEAFQRADGLISEIDKTIRKRTTSVLLELGESPLNPATWRPTAIAVKNYFKQLKNEMAVSFTSSSSKTIRSNNLPGIIVLIVMGLFLLFPATQYVSARMNVASFKQRTTSKNIVQLALSFLIFILPLVGFISLIKSVELANIFGYRGDAMMQALPAMSFAIFGFNWLGRNLFVANGPARELTRIKQNNLSSAYNMTLLMGVILGSYWLLNALQQGAGFSNTIMAVLNFPLVLIGGYGLILFASKVRAYRASLIVKSKITPISDKLTFILYALTMFAGIIGPLASGIGYSNIGAMLVFSTILTLAVLTGFFVMYALVALFVSDAAFENNNNDNKIASAKGGLFRVFLAFGFACLALPILALIWGARVTDLQDVWLSLSEGVVMGDTRISFTDFLTFVIIFSIGYTITRLIQSALRSAVLPNTKIEIGAQNALVTGVGYIGLFFAALFAITSTGLDLSSLAIVAGALSVGIGFGLQAIVSNFLSGIILLVERPIKVGDWISVGSYSGYVSKIAVRATTIDTFDQSNVIIPNADFISGTVTNMTHLSKRGRVKVPVGVAYDSDPLRVKEILMEIISANTNILKTPNPVVFLLGFGADSIDFEIRGILRDVNSITSTRSDVNFEILRRFAEEGIEIPFGQRDITIKNAAELGNAFQSKISKKT